MASGKERESEIHGVRQQDPKDKKQYNHSNLGLNCYIVHLLNIANICSQRLDDRIYHCNVSSSLIRASHFENWPYLLIIL